MMKKGVFRVLQLVLLIALGTVGVKVFHATTIDAEITGAKLELKSDGTLPFDNNSGKGRDTSTNNQIVRSYDEATYDLSFAVNSKSSEISLASMEEYNENKIPKSGELYDVEVTLSLPPNTDPNMVALTWNTSNFKPEDVKLSADKSTMTFYVRGIRVGQLYTKGVVLKTENVVDGKVIRPEANIKIVGSSSGVNIVADKEITATTNTNMNARITGGYTSNKVEVGGKEGRLHQFVIGLSSNGSVDNSKRGIGLPSGPIELILDFNIKAKNIHTQEMKEVDMPVEFFHTAPNGGKDTFGKEMGTEGYPKGVTTSKDTSSVRDSGRYTITPLGNNQFKVTITDYIIDGHFPIWNKGGDKVAGKEHYKANYLNFASQAFEFFIPFYNEKDASYDIYSEVNISSVKFQDTGGNIFTTETKTNDNSHTANLPEYLPGSISVSSYTNGKTSPTWTSGNATAQQGESICIHNLGHITSGADGYLGGGQMLHLFDGREYELTSTQGLYSSGLYHEINDEEIWYGVGKMDKDTMIQGGGVPNLDNFEWYTSLEEAKQNENPDEEEHISGIFMDTRTEIRGQGWPHLRSNYTVKIRKTVPVGTYIVNRTYYRVFNDVERNKPVGWVSTNKYTPSELDDNGNLVSGTHSPSSSHGGNTTKVIPYTTTIGMSILTKEDGKEKTTYQLKDGNTFDIKITGGVNSVGGPIDDDLKLKLLVPPGLELLEDTLNKPIHKKTENTDGSILYEFLYEAPHNNVFTPVTGKISIPLSTKDRTQFEIKAMVEAEQDKRNEERYRTTTKTISVIADASMQIVKSVDKNVVELGEEFTYTLTYANNSDKDYVNGVFLDILPFNGDSAGSNFSGSYVIESITAPPGVTVEGTAKNPEQINNEPLNTGVTDWRAVNPKDTLTALRFKVPQILKHSEDSIKIKLKPTGNVRGDVYYNSFKTSLEGLDLPLASNTVETRVISRDVKGNVWYDKNNNGTFENTGNNSEQILSDVTVELLDENSKVISTTTTDDNGAYIFRDVKPGNYRVRFKYDNGDLQPTIVPSNSTDKTNHVGSTTDDNGAYIFRDVKPGNYRVRFKYDNGDLQPTIVPSNSTDKTNHVGSKDLTSDIFSLLAVDTEKVLNLGAVTSIVLNKTLDTQIVNIGDEVKYTLSAKNLGAFNIKEYTIMDSVPSGIEVIVLNKTLDTQIVNIGDEVKYTLSAKNLGAFNIKEYTIMDSVPSGIEVVVSSISDGGVYDASNRTITWDLRNLQANSTETISFKAEVQENAIGRVQNVACVKGDGYIPELPSNEATFTVLEYRKRSSIPTDQILNPNQEYTYYIDIINKSSVDATDIEVQDTLDRRLNINQSSISDNGSYNSLTRTISWTVDVPANSTKTLEFKVNPKEPSSMTENIPNVATVNGNETNEVINKVGKPVLEVHKEVNKTTVREGEEITYTLTVTNTGTANSANVTLSDLIPTGSTLVQNSLNGGTVSVGEINWDLGVIQPNQSITKTFKVTADNLPTGTLEGDIINKAEITHKDDSIESNTVTTKVIKPQLEIEKSVNRTDLLTVGEELTYNITVRNTGTASEMNTVIKDNVPEFTELIEVLNNGIESNGEITWNLGELGVNEERTVQFKVLTTQKPNSTSWVISNTASVNGIDSNQVNNQVGVGSLAFSKEVDKNTATVGDTLTYTITVTNTGSYVLRDIEVRDTVPNGTYSEATPEWTIDELHPGETQTLSFKVKVSELQGDLTEDIITNIATVNGEETNEVETLVQIPRIESVKRSSVPYDTKLKVGDEIEYFIDITNTGSAPATDVLVEDNLPTNTTLVNKGQATKKLFRSTLSWQIAEILPGETVTVSFLVRLEDNTRITDNTWEVSNIATVDKVETNEVKNKVSRPVLNINKTVDKTSALEGDKLTYSIEVSNTGDIVDKVETNEVKNKVSRPVLNINKTVDKTSALEGDKLTYSIEVSNTGDISSEDLVITDNVSNKLEIVENSITHEGSLNSNLNSITWNLDPLDAGESLTLEFECTVKELQDGVYRDTIPNIATLSYSDVNGITWNLDPLDAGESLTLEFECTVKELQDGVYRDTIPNIATLSYSDVNGNKSVDSNEVNTEITKPFLVHKKTVTSDSNDITVGDVLTYTISVTNRGTAPALNVKIVDLAPKGTELVEGDLMKTISSLAPGETTNLTFKVRILKNEDDNLTSWEIKNTALVNNEETNEVVTLVKVPKLKIEKFVNRDDLLTLNEDLTYTIVVTNIGESTAKEFTVRSEENPHVEIQSVDKQGTYSGGEVTWNDTNLKPNESRTYTINTKTVWLDGIFDTFESNASVELKDVGVQETSESNYVINDIAIPLLKVTKTSVVDDELNLKEGDEISYEIEVTNEGAYVAKNVRIEDTIPKGLELLDGEESNVNLGNIQPNETVKHTFKTKIKPLPKDVYTMTYTNVATVKSDNNETVASNEVQNIVTKGDLVYTKSTDLPADGNIDYLGEFNYLITLRNKGDRAIENVKVVDTLPKGVQYLESDGEYDETTHTYSKTIERVEPKQEVQLKIKVKAILKEGTLENTAYVNDEPSNTVKSRIVSPKLKIEKSSEVETNSVVLAGEEIKYSIKVTNEGTSDTLEGLITTVTDTIPKGTTLVSINNDGVLDETTKKISWNIESIKKGESVEVSFVVKVNEVEDMDIVNTAYVTYAEETLESNETIHYLRHNKLTFNKSVDKPKDITSGEELLYTIEVTNEGTAPEKDLIISDTVPEHTSLLKVLDEGKEVSNTIEWKIKELPVGESLKVSFLVKVKDNLQDKTLIANIAKVNDMDTNKVENEVNMKEPVSVSTLPKTGGKAITYGTLVISVLGLIGLAIRHKFKS